MRPLPLDDTPGAAREMAEMQRTKRLRMGAAEWALLLVLSALWGASFFFFKVLVEELPPFTIVLGRIGIAAVALNLLLLARRDPMPASPRTWAGFAALGLLNNVIPF